MSSSDNLQSTVNGWFCRIGGSPSPAPGPTPASYKKDPLGSKRGCGFLLGVEKPKWPDWEGKVWVRNFKIPDALTGGAISPGSLNMQDPRQISVLGARMDSYSGPARAIWDPMIGPTASSTPCLMFAPICSCSKKGATPRDLLLLVHSKQ